MKYDNSESIRVSLHQVAGLITLVMTIFFVQFVRAETLTFSLGSSEHIETTDAVINRVLGYAHTSPQADQYDTDFSMPFLSHPYSVGDGSHGAFNSSTYWNFHTGSPNVDKIIAIDTDRFPHLNFTEFSLDAGWTLRPIGSKPLKIYSQSTITIDGVIDCSGADGEDAPADREINAAGGEARCGGGRGGQGGSRTIAASAGEPTMNNANGGGGPGTSEGDGGGGGGAMRTISSTSGNAFTGSGGVAGDGVEDSIFEFDGGGSGGGGGAVFPLDPLAPSHSGGSGGGGGGGSVYLYALGDIRVSATGAIRADGGNGGGVTGRGQGGPGGGGGGGSILAFTPADIVFDGPVTAEAGVGGYTDTGGSLDGDGNPVDGYGSPGRTWVIDSDGISSGSTPETPAPSALTAIGVVNYRSGTHIITSKLIDSGSSNPEFVSAVIDATPSTGGSVLLEVAGSDEEFPAASAAWVPASSISSLSGSRFLRFRILMDNQDPLSPTVARSVRIEFQPSFQTQFDFASCGSTVAAHRTYLHTKDKMNEPLKKPALYLIFAMPVLLLIMFRLSVTRVKATSRYQF